jgi:hypothetical protein
VSHCVIFSFSHIFNNINVTSDFNSFTVMRESNRNLEIPPGHTPGNLDFDVLVRSNSLHIFLIPVQIHYVLWKIWVQIPHPKYELEATAFRNFGITKFFFPSEIIFNRAKPFSCSQLRTTKLISSHLNSPLSMAPFWIQHTCLKENSRPPKQIPHLPLEKKVKFPPPSNTKQANSPGMPGGDVKVSIWFAHYSSV